MANQRIGKLDIRHFFEDEPRAAGLLIDGAMATLVLGFVSVVVAIYCSVSCQLTALPPSPA